MEHVQQGRVRGMRIVFVIFSLVHTGAGKLEIRKTDSPIDALLGENTTIPCLLYGYEASSLDISRVSVRWKRKDELVYDFIDARHIPYRSGSYISEDRLREGDASLYIPHIQTSDEGDYTCLVIVMPEDTISKVTVQVSAFPSCILSDSTLVMIPNTETSVTCYVNGFYPESVKIQWLKYSKASSNQSPLNSQHCTSAPVQNHDGTYNVTSVLSVRPMSTDEDGDVYSCVISHRSWTDGLNCNVSLSVHPVPVNKLVVILPIVSALLPVLAGVLIYIRYFKKAPVKITDIIGPELIHEKTTTLACAIENLKSTDIVLKLSIKKDDKEIQVDEWSSKTGKSYEEISLVPRPHPYLKLMPMIEPFGKGLFRCFCYIAITPQLDVHDGAKMILKVTHEAVNDPIYKERTLTVKAPPVLDPIKANKESYNVGDPLVLTCKIHSFHPQNINVTWCKDKEALQSKNSENSEAETNTKRLSYVTSRVQATIQEEDFRKEFICQVEHQGVTKVVTWKLQKQVQASEEADRIDF